MIQEINLPDQTHRVTSLSILSEDTSASVINSLKRLTGKEWENKFSKYFLKGGSVTYRQLIYKQLVGKSLGIPTQRITWNYSSSKYSVRRRSASGGANQSNNNHKPGQSPPQIGDRDKTFWKCRLQWPWASFWAIFSALQAHSDGPIFRSFLRACYTFSGFVVGDFRRSII